MSGEMFAAFEREEADGAGKGARVCGEGWGCCWCRNGYGGGGEQKHDDGGVREKGEKVRITGAGSCGAKRDKREIRSLVIWLVIFSNTKEDAYYCIHNTI